MVKSLDLNRLWVGKPVVSLWWNSSGWILWIYWFMHFKNAHLYILHVILYACQRIGQDSPPLSTVHFIKKIFEMRWLTWSNIIIISLPHLRPTGLLWSHASICRVCPKMFIHLAGNREFGKGFLSGTSKIMVFTLCSLIFSEFYDWLFI